MKRMTREEYVKAKGHEPLILHYQPHTFAVFETTDEMKKWAAEASRTLGGDESRFTWGDPTFSGDADRNDRVGDDCAT